MVVMLVAFRHVMSLCNSYSYFITLCILVQKQSCCKVMIFKLTTNTQSISYKEHKCDKKHKSVSKLWCCDIQYKFKHKNTKNIAQNWIRKNDGHEQTIYDTICDFKHIVFAWHFQYTRYQNYYLKSMRTMPSHLQVIFLVMQKF